MSNENDKLINCYFKIKPSDTLFLRDGFVFKKELNNFLESLDIPYPSVFYGAIFSALLRQGKFKDILGSINRKDSDINKKLEQNFRINGIYLYDEVENELYLKAPLDLFENEYGIEFGIYKNGDFYNPKNKNNKYERADNKYISLNDLIWYYSKADVKNITLYSRDYFFKTYKKTGIEIDRTSRTVKEEYLYRINMVEFAHKKFSYILKCEIDSEVGNIQNDVIKLGGETKLASLTYTNKPIRIVECLNEFYKANSICNNKVKLILLTPMMLNDLDFKYAVTGKPEYIGGFDMANGIQKSIRKAIPAGSVLILEDNEFKNKTINQILSTDIIKQKIRSIENYRGFGQIIIMPF